MPKYEVCLFEEAISLYEFIVEADSPKEAREKVLQQYESEGGTYSGKQISYEVTDSGINEEPTEIKNG